MQMVKNLFGGQPEEELQATDALVDAQDRVQRNPNDAGAHFDLGSVHYVRGNTEEAVKSLEQAVELAPDDGDAIYMLALAYERSGRRDEARQLFEAVLERSDNAMLRGYAERKLQSLEGGTEQEM